MLVSWCWLAGVGKLVLVSWCWSAGVGQLVLVGWCWLAWWELDLIQVKPFRKSDYLFNHIIYFIIIVGYFDDWLCAFGITPVGASCCKVSFKLVALRCTCSPDLV